MMPEYRASFWEHVDELRQTILRSLIIVGIGFIALLLFLSTYSAVFDK